MKSKAPFVRDLLLIGGGHAHVQVLRRFGMQPEPGVRLTLVTREAHTPYSGMLPGHIAGVYPWHEIHIDLMRLCAFADARFIHEEAVRVDPQHRTVEFTHRPVISYDLLSINCGGAVGHFPKGYEHTIPVKPLTRFLPEWEKVVASASNTRDFKLVIVGAGAGGVELAMAALARHRANMQVTLIVSKDSVLTNHNRLSRRFAHAELHKCGVNLVCGFHVVEIQQATNGSTESSNLRLISRSEETVTADAVLWVGGVAAPEWISKSGFTVDARGFLEVDKYLQAVDHDDVFAAGDAAALVGQPRPKSGVFAVREGPVLAKNLRAAAVGKKLSIYRAQKRALALLKLPNGSALASRGAFSAKGKWLWLIKDAIDRRFMNRFDRLPEMVLEQDSLKPKLAAIAPDQMRCGGCGAKLSSGTLTSALRRLDIESDESVQCGIGDDAAVVDMGSTRIVTSCDSFRTMISDPFTFGRIAAHHALNDLYAMNANPVIALALATVPVMAEQLMEDDLYQMLAGAVSVFKENNVGLVGGHSAEGQELSLGFAVTGTSSTLPLFKAGLKSGQHLLLTKAIGTGAILASSMQGKAPANYVLKAISSMDFSNAKAIEIAASFGATACTDISGFGLLGHLTEMLTSSDVQASLKVAEVQTLEGAAETIGNGIVSSLQEANESAFQNCSTVIDTSTPNMRLLADPQTSGGLLFAVESTHSVACLDALVAAGYQHAANIGTTIEGQTELIQLV